MARAGLTGVQLAERAGYSRSALQRRLSGEIEFTVTDLAVLAKILNIPLTALLVERPSTVGAA
jgi:transcriptional regulator with XRE-family HTH domain